MKIALIVVGVFVLLFVAFVVWRWTSVARGARRRDEKLIARIDPIGKKIDAGEAVTLEEIAALATDPEIRYILFAVLRNMNRLDLLPEGYSSSIAQGESALAYWMMHPNELQDAPAIIEFVETVKRLIDGREADFHVYRYKMAQGHWAEKDGWLLGMAGPMPVDVEAYSELPGAFSRVGDIHGSVQPAELVDWYVGMLRHKGFIK